jgi:hypothetical protein
MTVRQEARGNKKDTAGQDWPLFCSVLALGLRNAYESRLSSRPQSSEKARVNCHSLPLPANHSN